MGRGRSKARQTRVARDLKYSNQEMDIESLAKELHGEVETHNQDNKAANSYSEDNNPRV